MTRLCNIRRAEYLLTSSPSTKMSVSPPGHSRTSLTQLMDRPGPSRARRPDTIPDSCSEESDSDDEPIPLPGPSAARAGTGGGVPAWVTNGPNAQAGSSKRINSATSATRSAAPPARPVTPQQSKPRVNAVMGANGRMVYQAVSGSSEAFFYGVTW